MDQIWKIIEKDLTGWNKVYLRPRIDIWNENLYLKFLSLLIKYLGSFEPFRIIVLA